MQAWLRVENANANLRRIPLQAEVTIGRSSECNLKIASNLVSRRHCRLFVEDNGVFIQDLGSSNGTLVDGQVLTGQRTLALQDGARIQVGPAVFLLEYVKSAPVTLRKGPAAASELVTETLSESPVQTPATGVVSKTTTLPLPNLVQPTPVEPNLADSMQTRRLSTILPPTSSSDVVPVFNDPGSTSTAPTTNLPGRQPQPLASSSNPDPSGTAKMPLAAVFDEIESFAPPVQVSTRPSSVKGNVAGGRPAETGDSDATGKMPLEPFAAAISPSVAATPAPAEPMFPPSFDEPVFADDDTGESIHEPEDNSPFGDFSFGADPLPDFSEHEDPTAVPGITPQPENSVHDSDDSEGDAAMDWMGESPAPAPPAKHRGDDAFQDFLNQL